MLTCPATVGVPPSVSVKPTGAEVAASAPVQQHLGVLLMASKVPIRRPRVNLRRDPPQSRPRPKLAEHPVCPGCGSDDVFYCREDDSELVLVCCGCVAFEPVDPGN